MTTDKTTQVEVIETLNPETGEMVPVADWLRALPISTNAEDASDEIVRRILAAETAEELLTPAGGEGLQDQVGKALIIHDVRLMPSGLNADVGAFAILDVQLVKEDRHVICTTGAKNVLAQLVRAYERDWFPLACRVTETPSKSNPNRSVQWLVTEDAF